MPATMRARKTPLLSHLVSGPLTRFGSSVVEAAEAECAKLQQPNTPAMNVVRCRQVGRITATPKPAAIVLKSINEKDSLATGFEIR